MKPHKNRWFHSPRLLEVETAQAWGLTPSQFDALNPEDQAEMLALVADKARMGAWEAQVQADENKPKSRAGGQPPSRRRR